VGEEVAQLLEVAERVRKKLSVLKTRHLQHPQHQQWQQDARMLFLVKCRRLHSVQKRNPGRCTSVDASGYMLAAAVAAEEQQRDEHR
jgi:hypothetical protein